jgi:hypothetical protein
MSEPTLNFDFNSNARNFFPNRLFYTSNETTPDAVYKTQLATGDKFISLTALYQLNISSEKPRLVIATYSISSGGGHHISGNCNNSARHIMKGQR